MQEKMAQLSTKEESNGDSLAEDTTYNAFVCVCMIRLSIHMYMYLSIYTYMYMYSR